MDEVSSLQHKIASRPAVAVYFTGPDCSVCTVLRPKLRDALKEAFDAMDFIEVDIAASPEVSSNHGVFAVPTLLVFLDGKEFVRRTRNMQPDEIVVALRRPYGLLMS